MDSLQGSVTLAGFDEPVPASRQPATVPPTLAAAPAPAGGILGKIKGITSERQRTLARLWQQAIAASDAGSWAAALELFQRVGELDPAYADVQTRIAQARAFLQTKLQALYQKARELRDRGQWRAALSTLEEIHALQPGYPDPAGLRPWAEQQQQWLYHQANEERAHIERLLAIHTRNLQVLREQAARFGIDVPVAVATQIHEAEAAITSLRAQLQERLGQGSCLVARAQ